MIHLALTIASALFLIWFGAVVLALTWRVLLPIAIIVIFLFIVALLRHDDRPNTNSPTRAPTSPATSPQEWRSLPARLSSEPRLVVAVPGGTAWLVSAIETEQGRFRVLVEFKGMGGGRLIRNGSQDMTNLLKSQLCGANGILTKYRLRSESITLVAYEANERVAEAVLSHSYCR